MRVGLVVCAALLVSAPRAYASACNGGSCPAANLLVTGIPTPESAGTVSSVTITVQTSQGATATAYTGTVHFTASDAQATLPSNYRFTSCSTGCDNGVHKFTNGVVLKTAGTQTVTATDTASSMVKGSQTGIVVNPLSVSVLAVSGLTTPRAAGAAGTLTVTAKDPYGNTANGYLGRVHFTSSDGQAVLPADYTFTSTDSGTHSFSNGVTLKSAGTQSVNATDTSNGSISGGETGIVVNAGAASTLGVTGIASPRTANTASTATVTAKDAYGNNVTSYVGTVKFTSSDALALVPASYTFTTSDAGTHSFASGVTLKSVGTQSVTATDTKTATISGSDGGIVVVSNTATQLSVTGIANPVVAGTAASVTVKALDAAGSVSTGYAGTVQFTSNDLQAGLPTSYVFNSSDAGVHTFSNGVTMKTAGTQTVTATDAAVSSITGALTIQVYPAAASRLSFFGTPLLMVAGSARTVTVRALDTYGNWAFLYAGTVHFTATDSQAIIPTNYTFVQSDNGEHNFTFVLKTAGTQSISVADTATPTIAGISAGIPVQAAAAATLTVSGIPSPTTAGASTSAVVRLTDAYGNQATGYRGTVHFTSSDAQASLPSDYTFTNFDPGSHTFAVVLKTVGTQSVTATDTVSPALTGTQTGIQVNAGPAATLAVSGIASPTTAGATTSATVLALDACGNRATGYLGTIAFSSTDPLAALPANYAFVSTDQGSHSFTGAVVLKTAAAQAVTVTDTANAAITGNQAGIQVNPSGTTSLFVSGVPSTLTAGSTASITLEARDSFGNRATAYAGTVRFYSSDPQSTLPANFSFSGAGGIHSFASGVTLRTAGTQFVSAGDIATTSIAGQEGGISVSPAGANSLSLSVAGGPLTAGTSTSATVTAVDSYGNVATGYVGTVKFTSSDVLATLPANWTFTPGEMGIATVSGLILRTVGTQTVSTADTLTPAMSVSTPVSVVSNVAAALVVSGFPSPSNSGISGALTVTAQDAYGNVASGYRGTVSFSSSDARAVLPAATTFTSSDAGTRPFPATLNTSGQQSITATDGTLSATQSGITVQAGVASALAVTGVASPIGGGTAASFAVSAKDAAGNVATGYAGTVTFSSSDALAVLPAAYTFTTADAGAHFFSAAVTFRTVGTQSLSATDSVNASLTGTQSGISVTDTTPPTWPANTTLTASATSNSTAHLTWTAATDNIGVVAYRVYVNGALNQTVATLSADVSGLTLGSPASVQVQAGDAAGNWSTNGPTATVTPLPPNPQLIAPPLDMTMATTLADSTSFLYTGPNAIQTGVDAGTIDPKRVSVARGTVHDRAGAGIGGVVVTVLSHPELGQTISRADGTYDLALNGGFALTLVFRRAGLLDAQRTLNAVWQEFTQVDDVVMIPQDQMVTALDLTNTTSTQVARGSVTTDELGSRQATVLIPPGTQASLLMPDGSTRTVSSLHIRATEFTVGASGPAAMPAQLPPTSAYTYALRFSADEADAVGAKSVLFSQSVYGYVENFLAFRVGAVVPNGYYDHDQGAWVPLPNGRVIQILSITSGAADVDTDGSGVAADATKLAALNFSASERQQLAALYAPGQSLWRVPMQHFTDEDWNPSPSPLPGAGAPPDQPDGGPDGGPTVPPPTCTNNVTGSIIECETQVLGERVDVVGTPYSLSYRSSRQMGRRANYRLDWPVPAATTYTMPSGYACFPSPGRVPPCQNGVGVKVLVPSVVYVDVAGQHFMKNNQDTTAGFTWNFEWNGLDAYGRTVQGEQPIKVRTCYTSPAVYYAEGSDAALAFAAVQNTGASMSWRSGSFSFDTCREWEGKIGGWNDSARGLGGWTLSANHAYDPRNQTLYRGDGTRTSASDANRLVLNTVIGNGSTQPAPTEGAQARSIGVGSTQGLSAGPDGSIYFQWWSSTMDVWRMRPDNTLTKMVPGSSLVGAGNLALALGNEGRLYLADAGNGSYPARLLRRENDGTLSTLYTLPTSNGGSSGIAIGPEGAVYFSDSTRHRVMRRGTDGSVAVVAGLPNTTTGGFSGDGGLATLAQLNLPGALTIGRDGTLYIADTHNSRVRAVGVDGLIRTFAGSGQPCGDCGYYFDAYANDGASATQAGIGTPTSLAIARDGTLYIGEDLQMIRQVTPSGIIQTIARWTNNACTAQTTDCLPIGAPVIPTVLALEANGGLLVASVNNSIARIKSGFTVSQGINEQYLASSDASEIYVFDLAGRHLRTLDGLTTATLRTFGYDASGRLTSITDRDGNVTTVQRDAQGNPTAIVSPYGQTTTMSLDGNGYLGSITNPNQESIKLQYTPPVSGDNHMGGMLSQLTDPRAGIHLFEYNADGFLTKDTPPDGAYQSLDRGGSLSPTRVTHTTALGRTTTYAVSWNSKSKMQTSSVTGPEGFTSSTVINADNSTSTTMPDGTQITTSAAPDPRFGLNAFSVSSTNKTPSGLTRKVTESRTATMMSATDPITLKTLLTQFTLNNRTSSSTYDGVAKTITQTTPAGRQTVLSLDAAGRVVQIAAPRVQPVVLHYDSLGRNDSITQGTRVTTLAYDAAGFLHSVLDPAQHSTVFAHDLVGRPTSETLPNQSVIGMGYDASGNGTAVIPPSRPVHVFAFTLGDLESDYTPPTVDTLSSGHQKTTYNLDRQVSSVAPDGVPVITPSYDATNGRLLSVAFNAGTNSFTYSPATGTLSSIAAADGTGLAYAYDGSMLKSITWSGTVAGSVSKAYDSDFRVSSEQINTGAAVAYTYDPDSLLTVAGALSIARDTASGFVTGTTLGSVTDSISYNNYGEPQAYGANYGTTALYSADYGTRDGLGRIVTKTETVLGVSHTYGYSYDTAGRLTDVTNDSVLASHYAYDANGNRIDGPGLTSSPAYDAQDRLLSYGNCTYAYKADGSLQTKTCGTSMTTYDDDAFGSLRHVTLPSGANIDYVIDGQNRRVGKKVNGALIEGFLYRSQLQPAAWLDGTGVVKATFVYGLQANVPEYMVRGTTTYRFITDQVGSVRQVVDSSTGAVAERIDYDEFGNVLADSAPGTQPFGFGGGLRDLDTGLTRFGARDYDPAIGRWTAKDPLQFGGGLLNLYSYLGGDPIALSDPTGLGGIILPPPPPPSTWPIIGAVGGGIIGGTVGATIGATGGSFVLPGVGTIAGGFEGGNAGAAAGSAAGAAAGAALALYFDPPPFYPGWKPPPPQKTTCTVEQSSAPQDVPPQKPNCELLFTTCISHRSYAFCAAVYLICKFGPGS